MPNVTEAGHISMTVDGNTTKMLVLPETYQQVDIVDFAPRAVAGTPAYSTLGLYLDVAQESFKHGFGQWEQSEPQMYSYSGQQVDTRHGHAQLYTNYSTVLSGVANLTITDFIVHKDIPIMISQAIGSAGVGVLKPSDGSYITYTPGHYYRHILSNGKYLFFSRLARLRVGYFAQPTNVAGNVATFSGADFEDTDQWAGGSVWIFDGSGVGTTSSIASSTGDTITVSSWTGTAPDIGSWCMLINDTGNDGNPPNNFDQMTVFGGSMWAVEEDSHYLHYWSTLNGSTAEGDGTSDLNVIEVGPPGGKITNLAPFQNQLYVFREDGIWTINEQDTDALAYHSIPFDTEAHENNFSLVVNWQGFLIYSLRNRLYKFKSGIQDMTPPVWDEYPPYKQFGDFQGGIPRGSFLYILGKSNSANSDELTEATTGFVSLLATDGVGWHKLMDLPVTNPNKYDMWLDTTNDYLYLFAKDNTNTGRLWRVQLQTYSDLAYANYPTSGDHNLYTSYYNFGMRRIPKSFASLTVHGELSANQKVTVSYRVDDAVSWTSLGEFTSDLQEINFPTGVTGKRIQFRLELSTTSSVSTPIIRAIILKVMLRPDVKWGVTCDIRVADNLTDQRGIPLGHTKDEIRQALETARSSVAPFTFVDLLGVSRTAYLASMSMQPIMYEDTNAVEIVARSTFVFV